MKVAPGATLAVIQDYLGDHGWNVVAVPSENYAPGTLVVAAAPAAEGSTKLPNYEFRTRTSDCVDDKSLVPAYQELAAALPSENVAHDEGAALAAKALGLKATGELSAASSVSLVPTKLVTWSTGAGELTKWIVHNRATFDVYCRNFFEDAGATPMVITEALVATDLKIEVHDAANKRLAIAGADDGVLAKYFALNVDAHLKDNHDGILTIAGSKIVFGFHAVSAPQVLPRPHAKLEVDPFPFVLQKRIPAQTLTLRNTGDAALDWELIDRKGLFSYLLWTDSSPLKGRLDAFSGARNSEVLRFFLYYDAARKLPALIEGAEFYVANAQPPPAASQPQEIAVPLKLGPDFAGNLTLQDFSGHEAEYELYQASVLSRQKGKHVQALVHLRAALGKEPRFADFVPAQMIAASLAVSSRSAAADSTVRKVVFEGKHPDQTLDEWQIVRALVARAGDDVQYAHAHASARELDKISFENGWGPEFVKAATALRAEETGFKKEDTDGNRKTIKNIKRKKTDRSGPYAGSPSESPTVPQVSTAGVAASKAKKAPDAPPPASAPTDGKRSAAKIP